MIYHIGVNFGSFIFAYAVGNILRLMSAACSLPPSSRTLKETLESELAGYYVVLCAAHSSTIYTRASPPAPSPIELSIDIGGYWTDGPPNHQI